MLNKQNINFLPKITKTNLQTFQEAKSFSTIEIKLKSCDPEIQNYFFAMKKENLKLQKQIAKLQAENETLKNRIKVLEAEQYRPKAKLIIKGLHKIPPSRSSRKEIIK